MNLGTIHLSGEKRGKRGAKKREGGKKINLTPLDNIKNPIQKKTHFPESGHLVRCFLANPSGKVPPDGPLGPGHAGAYRGIAGDIEDGAAHVQGPVYTQDQRDPLGGNVDLLEDDDEHHDPHAGDSRRPDRGQGAVRTMVSMS